MMKEIWDAYNEKEEKLNEILVRGEPIPDRMFHLVVEVLIRHTDGDYLLMKRCATKDLFPNYYEATAGGSALTGETAEIAIKREAWEETGIVIDNLELINKLIEKNVIFYSFVTTVDTDKTAVTIQVGETTDFKWINEKEFITFMDSEDAIPTQKTRLQHYCNKLKSEDKTMNEKLQFEPTSNSAIEFSNNEKLAEWLQQFLRGEGNNLGFADGLLIDERIYHTPKLMKLEQFERICGPEEGLKWQIDESGFNWRVGKIVERFENGNWDMPPLIINCQNGVYELNDGNHRYEALKRMGITEHWVIFWETVTSSEG